MIRPVLQVEVPASHSYEQIWELQGDIQQCIVRAKKAEHPLPGVLMLCEHKPVYTLGKSGSMTHLLLNRDELEKKGTEFFKINRGGDITYHGPGQITVYPILDLDQYYHDLHRFVRDLEEVIIRLLADFELVGERVKEYSGVWLKNNDGPGYRKICAIGVHMSRWVSMHGFALNVNTNLDYFSHITACGITAQHMTVTSLQKELGSEVSMDMVKGKINEKFAEVFGVEYI